MTAITAAQKRSAPGLLPLLIGYGGFVLLGLPDGMLSVAWPLMYRDFGVPLDALGVLLPAFIIGYVATTSGSGRLVARLGIGVFLLLGAALRAGGMIGFALAPSWVFLIVMYLAAGVGTGAIDAGLNTFVAAHYSAGRMSWLHASFGLGAAIGPLVMTAAITASGGWQAGYLLVGVLQAVIAALMVFTLPRWTLRNGGGMADDAAAPAPDAPALATLRLPLVWLGIATFAFYTGLEFSTGQWPYTLFTEGRGVSIEAASAWVSLYWAGLTAGRLLTGFIVDRIGPERLLRLSMIGAVIGTGLIWLPGGDLINALGLALTGFALAAIFPTLISTTPDRVGAAHAANTIGFQIGAAGAGVAVLPSLAGVLAVRVGLEVIGPFLVVVAVMLWLLFEALAHTARQKPGQD